MSDDEDTTPETEDEASADSADSTESQLTDELVASVAQHDEALAASIADHFEAHAQLEETVTSQEERLADYEAEVEELKGRLKRKQADFQNYKKRAKKRQEQLKERATEDLVERLLGVRDNLKRALEEEDGDVDSLREGVEMTLREFDRVLADENVSEIEPEPGTDVDPQRHEVMMQVDSDQPEGTVAEVFTPGYEMGEKVIQSAQVTVSNGALNEEEDETDGQEPADERGEPATADSNDA